MQCLYSFLCLFVAINTGIFRWVTDNDYNLEATATTLSLEASVITFEPGSTTINTILYSIVWRISLFHLCKYRQMNILSGSFTPFCSVSPVPVQDPASLYPSIYRF